MARAAVIGLWSGFAILAGVGVLGYATTDRLVDSIASVERAHRVVEALDLVDDTLADTPVRGDAFLAAHASLDALVENPEQQQRVDRLRALVDPRGEGVQDARRLIGEMQAYEHRELADREEQSARGITYERLAQTGGLLGSIAIFAFAFVALRRESRRRLQSEQAARATNRFLDSIVENIPHMVFVKDARDLAFVQVNRAGERLLHADRASLIGTRDRDAASVAKDREVLANRTLVDVAEEPIETASGTRWLHTKKIPILADDGSPGYLLGISEDITDRKALADELSALNNELERRVTERTTELRRIEGQLRQSQKLDAIGRLAGGIAHDFNNLLSVILGYTQMMLDDLPATDPMHADLREVHSAGERATGLTRQLLAFSRQQVLAPRTLDLNDIVAGMTKLLQRVIGEDVELRVVAGRGLARVKVDPGQLEQVIMNLAVNARDAMPRGGHLGIETANVALDATYAANHPEVRPGSFVMLAVTDSGTGMDQATQAQIFDPFFTTKEQGKGTGLGLSTVFGIVRQSGGSIWVYSEPGAGTAFKIYLPATEDEAEAIIAPAGATTKYRGSETILLVEDEPQVRMLARGILARSGYQVLEAANGIEALAMSERFSGVIHLLVTDVVMPKMSGRELVEKLGSVRRTTRVLYMSGYTDDTVVHHGVLDHNVAFLQKPLMPDAFLRKVREVLGASGPGSAGDDGVEGEAGGALAAAGLAGDAEPRGRGAVDPAGAPK